MDVKDKTSGLTNPVGPKNNTESGWTKYKNNPVLGGSYGTCFDIGVIKDKAFFRMYFSWRPKKSIALVESTDGINWCAPWVVLGPETTDQGWEDDVNRPVVVEHDEMYHMWYTGQYKPGATDGRSWLFYANSIDGLTWNRATFKPVLSAEKKWEKSAVMSPHVLWDERDKLFKLWYSAGEQYEPNAIGFATSSDGINWTKSPLNPIFTADKKTTWEQHKVAGCQVVYQDGWYIMFYIGYRDEHYAQIGMARSRDGITNWERYSGNPIVVPDEGKWDGEACYKPYIIWDEERWLMWYNGRTGTSEQIGLVIHDGSNIWN